MRLSSRLVALPEFCTACQLGIVASRYLWDVAGSCAEICRHRNSNWQPLNTCAEVSMCQQAVTVRAGACRWFFVHCVTH